MKRARRRLSLRLKWTLALVLTSAVPLVIFATMALRIQQRGLEAIEQDRAAAMFDSAAREIEYALDEAERATHEVGRVLGDARIASEEARLGLAREAVAGAPVLDRVVVYGPDGKLFGTIAQAPAGTGQAPTPAAPDAPLDRLPSWVGEEVADGDWVVPAPMAATPPRKESLAYVEPIGPDTKDDKDRRGWVMGVVRARALGDLLGRLAEGRYHAPPDALLLVDREQRILAGRGQGALAVGQSLAGKEVFAEVGRTPASPGGALPLIEREAVLVKNVTSVDGRPLLGLVRPLGRFGGALVVRRSLDAAYDETRKTRWQLVLAGVLFSALAAGLGILLGGRATRPVGTLVALARAYGARDFTARSTVRSGDELEELGGAMTEMAGQISASEREIVRRATVEKDLSRYLPAEVARTIAEGRSRLTLGGERRAISVMFADLASFTPFAESAPPEKVVAFLNELFTTLTEVVFRNQGTVDKFMGDSMLALFGAPEASPDHVRHALATAEDMHRFVEASAPDWKERYGVDARLAIGIACGEALVGNLGSEARMEYTAIGDVVNVAARLEFLARPGQTLVTAEVVAGVGEGFSFTTLGEHPLRGKQQPVAIFQLGQADPL
ncbi:MAG TPA: adenylate/guanylate cyclase domain-containing protein [Polyangia bacterium]|jgi:class 3 adenylate cyclase|nr:adenylate/guanylate cyclase domain-containing protein [Polyangia bacterium]